MSGEKLQLDPLCAIIKNKRLRAREEEKQVSDVEGQGTVYEYVAQIWFRCFKGSF